MKEENSAHSFTEGSEFKKCHFNCGDTELERHTCGCYNDYLREKAEEIQSLKSQLADAMAEINGLHGVIEKNVLLLKQREEEVYQLNNYKIQAYEQLNEIKELKEALRDLLPIAQWGYDLLVPFDKEHMGKEFPTKIDKAKKLL
jgi:DNA repair exonuclease SbcCD ATPase subunit